MSLPDQITRDRGQPGTFRVGTIVDTNPLAVSVQGTVFVNVGVLAGYVPVVGDVVAVAGQSAVSSDGSSWLVLGEINSLTALRPDVRVLAAKQRATVFDSATFTAEAVIGGDWNLSVPLPANHLVELFMTCSVALTTGVVNMVTLRLREDTIAGAVVWAKNIICGSGNSYYSQIVSCWLRPAVAETQLYVLTAQASLGTGQLNVATSDVFLARDHGLASFVTVVP